MEIAQIVEVQRSLILHYDIYSSEAYFGLVTTYLLLCTVTADPMGWLVTAETDTGLDSEPAGRRGRPGCDTVPEAWLNRLWLCSAWSMSSSGADFMFPQGVALHPQG